MRPLALVLLAALLVAGCTGREGDDARPAPTHVATFVPVSGLDLTPPPPTGSPTPASPAVAERGLTIRTLGAGQDAQVRDQGRVYFTDAGGWTTFWGSLREDPADGAPSVDFEHETVLLALRGASPTGCHTIRITGAWLVDGEVRANVTVFDPEPTMPCDAAVSYPWHAVAVDQPEARVAWDERASTGAPPP